jgi:hypothetical protein
MIDECKRDVIWGDQQKKKGYWGVKRIKVHHSIMKPTNTGIGMWYGGELNQSILHTCMELWQWNPLMLLVYANSKCNKSIKE